MRRGWLALELLRGSFTADLPKGQRAHADPRLRIAGADAMKRLWRDGRDAEVFGRCARFVRGLTCEEILQVRTWVQIIGVGELDEVDDRRGALAGDQDAGKRPVLPSCFPGSYFPHIVVVGERQCRIAQVPRERRPALQANDGSGWYSAFDNLHALHEEPCLQRLRDRRRTLTPFLKATRDHQVLDLALYVIELAHRLQGPGRERALVRFQNLYEVATCIGQEKAPPSDNKSRYATSSGINTLLQLSTVWARNARTARIRGRCLVSVGNEIQNVRVKHASTGSRR